MQEFKSQKILLENLHCPGNYPIDLFCCSQQCQKCSFVCRNNKCKCSVEQHPQCLFINAQCIIKNIQNKKKKLSQQTLNAIIRIQNILNQCIEKLSNDRQALISWKENYGLNQNQVLFLQAIKTNQKQLINGQMISNIRKNLKESHNNQWLNQEWVINYWKQEQQCFYRAFQGFTSLIKNQNVQISSSLMTSFNSVITTQIKRIASFFDKPILKFELLYRASEHNFSAAQFHKLCDGVPQTLVLVETNHKRIIGGYTPIPWEKASQSFKQIQDQTGQSFLFSLTNNQKYSLVNKSKALRHDAGHGPIFGGGSSDFFIASDARKSSSSYFNFPGSYNNGKYIQSKDSYSSFIGTSDNYYTSLKDWQVFKVKFIENK